MPQEPTVRVFPEKDDYLHLALYQDRTVFARRFWLLLIGVPLFLFGLAAYEFVTLGGLMATLRADPAAVSVPAVAVLWVVTRWHASKRTAKRLAAREPPGERTFRIDADGLFVDNGSRKLKHKWAEMVEVVETGDLLLFVHKKEPGLFRATMVPMKSARGDAAAFRIGAIANWQKARAPTTA